MFRSPVHHQLVRQLAAIAKEKSKHFEVNQWLKNVIFPLHL